MVQCDPAVGAAAMNSGIRRIGESSGEPALDDRETLGKLAPSGRRILLLDEAGGDAGTMIGQERHFVEHQHADLPVADGQQPTPFEALLALGVDTETPAAVKGAQRGAFRAAKRAMVSVIGMHCHHSWQISAFER